MNIRNQSNQFYEQLEKESRPGECPEFAYKSIIKKG